MHIENCRRMRQQPKKAVVGNRGLRNLRHVRGKRIPRQAEWAITSGRRTKAAAEIQRIRQSHYTNGEWTAEAIEDEDGCGHWRPRCKRNLTFLRSVRVQPCIRPLSAAAMAAGP